MPTAAILHASELSDRQLRGFRRAESLAKSPRLCRVLSENDTLWESKRGNHSWLVERSIRNRRGVVSPEYRCQCGDFKKNGRIDCEHIFAERIRRGEAIVIGEVETRKVERAVTGRQPARERTAFDGTPIRTAQRKARIAFGRRLPDLLSSLMREVART
jgi:hypothetical protein